ncbi:hypothetical protein [Reyranella sp. CPCC 100927]|uniref:hypothetical protein n=1 Tax=Reyranella sp. CPCC 100927 TaxID=2599616 RepID=UPI0011B4D0EB|nr:hypothetical protein [Reyranella sp. CPCC 100927]TWT05648.1 hypothetical protein FQU96_24370 [Reyranella sp. CPCC 100927]
MDNRPSWKLALGRRVADILRSPACQRMDYWYGGLHIDGAGFRRVATLVENGRIDVIVEAQPDKAAASYSAEDAFSFSRADWGAGPDLFERVAIVHEAVHALRDTHGRTLMYAGRKHRPLAVTDEAMAYVAGCLYSIYLDRLAGRPPDPEPLWLTQRKATMHREAYAVALRMWDLPPGTPVSVADAKTLRVAYRTSTRKLRGTAPPRYYSYDGVKSLPRQ